MLFHNIKSYNVLHPYKAEAIMKGYLHPREYASLNYNRHGAKDKELYFEPCTPLLISPRLTKPANNCCCRRMKLIIGSSSSPTSIV